MPENGGLPDSPDLEPLFRTILETIPAPTYDDGAPLQAHVTNLDASPFLGRLALLRVHQGTLRKGQNVAWMRRDGSTKNVRVTELLVTEGLERKPGESRRPRRHRRRRRHPRDHHRRDPGRRGEPDAAAADPVDEPAISMTIGTNTSPLVGRVKGSKVTARLVKDRLDSELVGNVSLRVLPTERPDAWEVQGRGELALAILVEQMRREGYELTVGKPQVVTKDVDGKVHEPIERLTTCGLPTWSLVGLAARSTCSTTSAWTSHVSGRSVGRTGEVAHRLSRSLTSRAVTFDPFRAADTAARCCVPMVIEIAGSSTAGRWVSGSARVLAESGDLGIPAMAAMSPGPAWSAGTRSSPSVVAAR